MSSLSRATQPVTEDDAFITDAVAQADLPSLLTTLAHLTGDLSLIADDLLPTPAFLSGEQGGLSAEQQATARARCEAAIERYRDGGCTAAPAPSDADLRRMLDFITGKTATEEYVPLLLEELAYPRDDARAPRWRLSDLNGNASFVVAIIGAGMSGILTAIRLKQAGVSVVIIDKNEEVGGTWWENRYPGVRVDNSNHLYSYSFAQKTDWPFYFSTGEILADYFKTVAETYGVRDLVRFQTEVESATFDQGRCRWTLALRSPRGAETLEANVVVSAVGQLNRPKMPEIPGLDAFQGPWFHSARWNDDVDLQGKRVIVIGNGASASQFIPEVARDAGTLHVFQRTATWYVPVPIYHDRVAPGMQWLFQHIPHYAQWYRFWLFWTTSDGLLEAAYVDPQWPGPIEMSVSQANDELRQLMTDYLQASFQDRPDLFEKLLPHYPPASKRVVMDNGIIPETYHRPNVHLITDAIAEITPTGLRTQDGTDYPADVIIYGTGFEAPNFLAPMRIYGRGGVELHDQWQGDARAYMGLAIPNFPNLFCLYGPNTNIVVNGSTVYFSECGVNYIVDAVHTLAQGKHGAMEVKQAVHDRYNAWIDQGNLARAWGISRVPSWYKNRLGRSAQNWPYTLLEYWQQTQRVNPDDYEFIEPRVTAGAR